VNFILAKRLILSFLLPFSAMYYRFSTLLKDNKYFFGGFLAYLFIGLVLLATVPKGQDIWFFNHLHNPYTDVFFKYLTHIGDGLFAAMVVLCLLWVRFASFLIGLLSFALTGGVVQLLKRVVFPDAFRPLKHMGDNIGLHLVEGVSVHRDYSFPSGHSATAFMAFCLLALCVKNKYWGGVFLLFAIITSLSRPYLVQHFFEDTYAGALIGVGITTLIWYGIENTPTIRNSRRWQSKL
jgi:membrane-associated phospholipid phosphatase